MSVEEKDWERTGEIVMAGYEGQPQYMWPHHVERHSVTGVERYVKLRDVTLERPIKTPSVTLSVWDKMREAFRNRQA